MKAFEVVIHCSGLVLDIQQEKEVLYFWLSCGHWPKRQAIPFIPRTVEFAEMVQIEVFQQNFCAKIYRVLRWVSQKTETISAQIMNTWDGHLKQQKANIYRLGCRTFSPCSCARERLSHANSKCWKEVFFHVWKLFPKMVFLPTGRWGKSSASASDSLNSRRLQVGRVGEYLLSGIRIRIQKAFYWWNRILN